MKSASGLVLFSFAAPLHRKKILEDLTAHGALPAELDELHANAKSVLDAGYACLPSRMVEGVTDIGAPIFDSTRNGAVASLTVPFVVTRHAKVSLKAAPDLVAEGAKRISAALGFGPVG
jgi:DNA-binding IclR family transcriptional regulator